MAEGKTASCLTFLCVICCIVGVKSCGDTQCQVLVQKADSASLFRSMATEEGVRLVYLNLGFFGQPSDESYKPLFTKNKILPYRWTWAQSVSEALLSVSYDFDVLSLGLLKNQVRDMVVPLKDSPSGCLKALNSSCQDIAIARALLDLTRDRNSTPSNEREDVVCVRMLYEYSFGVGGGFKYQCCGEDRRQNNKSEVHCNLNVIESAWLAIFNGILVIVVGVVFFYWPLLLCSSSDVVKEDDFNNRRIPIDDFSPITCARIFETYRKKLSTLSHSDNVKLFFLWYCVIPVFFYIKVILYLIFKRSPFNNASKKLLFQAFNSYFYVFDFDRPLVFVVFIFPFFIIPGAIISCWRPRTSPTETQAKCCLGSEKFLDPVKEILQHVQVIPQNINSRSKFFLDRCRCKFGRNCDNHSQHSVCGHAICVLRSVASAVIMGPVFAVLIILVYVFVSGAYLIAFSPCTCLVITGFRFFREIFISKGVLSAIFKVIVLAALVYSAISVFLVVCFSAQFAVRTFAFVIMGVALNAEFAVPYITFLYVVWRIIFLCYRNLQNKYKEVKEMISEQWKEVTKDESGTIPIDLYWKVCNEFKVLPVVYEIFLMLRNVVFIVVFLIVVLTAILLFKVKFNSSAIVSSVAVVLSGKLAEIFFTGVTAGYSFSGWEKICKRETIARAVREVYEGNAMRYPKKPHMSRCCRLTSPMA